MLQKNFLGRMAHAKVIELQKLIDILKSTTVGDLKNKVEDIEQNQNIINTKLNTLATAIDIEFNIDGTLRV